MEITKLQLHKRVMKIPKEPGTTHIIISNLNWQRMIHHFDCQWNSYRLLKSLKLILVIIDTTKSMIHSNQSHQDKDRKQFFTGQVAPTPSCKALEITTKKKQF